MSSLYPLQKKLGLRRAKHLLRRATFRYSKPDIDQFADLTADQAVDLLFLQYSDPIPEPQDPQDPVSPYWINTIPYASLTSENRKKNYVKAAWIHNATANTSIKYKMMLFLYNQFTISTATGKSVEMNGCQVAVFENGKMKKSTQYYNMMTMMAQLGLMPE